jgi:hypothetical protein
MLIAACVWSLLQVSQVKSDLAAAKAAAAKEAKRASALQQDLEILQEQATCAAIHTVDELVGDLTQGHETDDSEQPAQQQRRPKAGRGTAGRRPAAAGARSKAGSKAAAVAATPVLQTVVFSAGPAAELSEIEEGDEEGEDEDGTSLQQAAVHAKQQQQRGEGQEATGTARRPRSAKFKAQQHIKAAAAADITPPSEAMAAAAADDDDMLQAAARRVSPRTK